MPTIIISDVHIGSPHFRRDAFCRFLASLPDGTTLVLNGDTINHPCFEVPAEDRPALDALDQASQRLKLIWVRGNHDDGYRPDFSGDVEFAEHFAVGKRLFAAHGNAFDNVMKANRWFVLLFRLLHHLRVKLGAQPIHVAEYAKRWRLLYNFLRGHVRNNALEHAREQGYAVVACGHVHHHEDSVSSDGIRYLNTGAWTETPSYCIIVKDDEIVLAEADNLSLETRPE